MSYVIYLRKSRADAEAEQHGEGETLARHEKALLKLANLQNLNIDKIYREVVSGETIASRPMMRQLLSEVEACVWDGVLVMEVERLARGDTIDQGIVAQTFKFSDTKIITPSKIYDPNNEFDEEYFEFGLFMSRREYKTINRRLQRGRIASVREGKYVANKPPYGYTRKRLEHDKGFTLAPLQDQAKVIKMIFDLYTRGEMQEDGYYRRIGISLIVRKLNSLKIKPQKGKAWVLSSVRDILTNPVYIGKIRWNWRPSVKKMVNGQVIRERPRSKDAIIVEGLHEAIISKDVFNKAQKIIHSNPARPVSQRNILKNPLAGLVVCGKCGRAMIRRPSGSKTKYDTLMCSATHCTNISAKLETVEKRILLTLEKWLSEYKINLKNETKNYSFTERDVLRNRIKQFDTELEETQKQLNNIYDFYEKGIYSTDIFMERSKKITERLEIMKADKPMLENKLNLISSKAIDNDIIVPKIEHILGVYDSLPTAQAKNDLLKEIIKSITYTKERSGHFKDVDPADFTLDVRLILH
jgi:site-specific DNA recombinase